MKHWIQAARLRTLPLSISGILVGTAVAISYGYFDAITFILALLTTVGFQVLSNYANDYGDGVKGTDANRVGEQRLVNSGIITAKQMKKAIVITSIITLIIALGLIYRAFGVENFGYSVLFFLLGIASIVAAIKYTVGKSAYGYTGFGDLFVFIFFGLVSVIGSFFLYTQVFYWKVILPAVAVGLLSIAVLNLNNMRDRENDIKAGKNTIVVKLGVPLSKFYHYFLIIISMVCMMLYSILSFEYQWEIVYLVAFIPLVIHLITVKKNTNPVLLDSELKKVALSTFFMSLLFLIGKFL
ncbi:1,4-dihydroxy-2-naphthoate octaprenyltransferase [Neptunitalea lumnitzerae]|uniref:1,4-dihydroxy-2-naphthoate octaprenyltransferase n=1 Tax=Neptunitalea lumnitzerae TaxID=2965509 RepID=A0ABQ5MIF4_9FLAO|nr:1,4-dihydroxy-2-naphthoate octaprenyltransferase [Neptunitalea sp. Y10]GLB49173.1 1,4-dihydroxy-2-naphthoate octaprenyltransferase [Neptunitalea sp. Y10]